MSATAATAAGGFSSLEQLTDAHEELCLRHEELFEDEHDATPEGETTRTEFWAEVRAFVQRASATGTVLQVDAERSVALNLIVYWCNAIYRGRHESLSADLAKFNVGAARALADNEFPYFRMRGGGNDDALAPGWQRQVEACFQILQQKHFLSVVGAAGSGRSSLVASGLVPALRAGRLAGVDAARVWLVGAGQRDPFRALAAALAPAFPGTDAEMLASRWRHAPGALGTDLRRTAPGCVLIIDQFEECVGRCEASTREAFARTLIDSFHLPTTGAAAAPGEPLLILVLRSDAVNDLAEFPALQRSCEEAEFFVAFDTVELREAIEAPAKRIGLFFEPALVDRILRDVQGDPAALTLLGFTLEQLWKLRGGNRNLMTWAAYHEVGSCRRALDSAAERALRGLPGLEEVARETFLMLVRPNWGDRFVAEPAPRARLEARHPEAGQVIDAFLQAGLLRAVNGDIALAQEALVTHWKTFSRWIDQKRLAMQDRLALTAAAGQWVKRRQDASMLWRGTKLAEASAYEDLSPLEYDFLRAGRRAQNRSRLRKQVALFLIAALMVGVLALWVLKERAERRLTAKSLYDTRLEISATLNEKGISALESGDPAGGALWFTTAVQLREDAAKAYGDAIDREVDAGRELDSRRIACTLRQLPPLARFVDMRRLIASSISPDGTRAVLVSRSEPASKIPGGAQLWDLATGRTIPLDRGEAFRDATVSRAAFDTTGALLVTASGEPGGTSGAVHVWNARTGEQVGEPILLPSAAVDASFHPRDPHLLLIATIYSGASSGDALIFDRNAGMELMRLSLALPVSRAVFSPDGRRVATSGAEASGTRGEACIWHWEDYLPLPLKHTAPVNDVSFSSNGRWVVTASGESDSESGEAQVWDAATGDPVGLPLPHNAAVVTAKFSPDDTRILTASSKDGTARIWDPRNRRASVRLRHGGYVFCADWSPDGRSVVTGSRDQMARVWDADTGRLLLAPLFHGGTVTDAHFSPDGRHLLAITLGNARLWDLTTHGTTSPPLSAPGTVTHSALSPDGLWLALATRDDFFGTSEVRINHTTTGALRSPPISLDGPVARLAFSPDGKSLATAIAHRPTRAGLNRTTGEARVWDADTARPRTSALLHEGPVSFVTFNANDGARLLTLSKGVAENTNVEVWDVASARRLSQRQVEKLTIACAAISADGLRAACGGGVAQPKSGIALAWSVDDPAAEPVRVTHDEIVRALAFAPDGHRLLTGSTDDAVKIWDARTGELVNRLLHTADVTSVDFSPDGTRVVSTSFDGSAAVWDAATGTRVATCRHSACVRNARFSQDGRYLVTASDDTTARVWNAHTGEPVAILPQSSEVSDAGFVDGATAKRIFALSYYWPAPILDAPTPASFTTTRSPAARSSGASRPDFALDAPRQRVDLRFLSIEAESRALEEIERDAERLAARHIQETAGNGSMSVTRQVVALPYKDVAALERPNPAPLDLGEVTRARYHDDEATRCEFREAWRAAAWHSARHLALEKTPRSDALIRDARIHARLRDDWKRVATQCTAALANSPLDLEALRLRAEARIELVKGLNADPAGWQQVIDDLETARKVAPHDLGIAFKLAEVHVILRAWERAAAVLDAVRKLELASAEVKGPRSPAWQRLAATCLAASRAAADAEERELWEVRYRAACAELQQHFGGIADFGAMVAWPALLAEDSGIASQQLVDWAQAAVVQQPTNYYRINTLGAALYRSGRYKDAIERLDESRKFYALAHTATLARSAYADAGEDPAHEGRPVDQVFLALAHQAAGQPEQARQWLDRAQAAVDASRRGGGNEPLSSRRVWNLAELEILLGEARARIQ